MNDFRKLLKPARMTEPNILPQEVQEKIDIAMNADTQATSRFLFREIPGGLSSADGNHRAYLMHTLDQIIESADAGRRRFGADDIYEH